MKTKKRQLKIEGILGACAPKSAPNEREELAGIHGYIAPRFPAHAIRYGEACAMIGTSRLVYFPRGYTARQVREILARQSRLDALAEHAAPVTKRAEWHPACDATKHKRGTPARLTRARELREARKLARLAGKAAYVTQRFHANGSAKRAESGEIVEMRDGTGRPIEFAALEEMRAEACAAAIGEPNDDNRFRAAANAAQKTLRRALREPAYEDAEKAQRAQDRAFRRAREAWADDDCAPNDKQPHCAEFLISETDESYLAQRAIALRAQKRARMALRAHYASKRYPRAKADHIRDLQTIRALTWEIASGDFSALKWAEDTARAQRYNDLAKRTQNGFAILATPQKITITGLPSLTAPERELEIVDIPATRAELFAADIKTRAALPVARRILAKARATKAEIATLREWAPAMA